MLFMHLLVSLSFAESLPSGGEEPMMKTFLYDEKCL